VAIRGLTCEAPEVFERQLREQLHAAGVLLVLVPAIPRTRVSGVARWLGPSRPLIQLSLYGKTNDKFWFTFFHEAAHVLLHAKSAEDKKSVFLDDSNASHSQDPKEQEANQWAGDWLIPRQHAQALPNLRSKESVIDFARHIGVHPGIVVGRLQHDGHIEPSWMNQLKQSFRFTAQCGA
jgi:HTH-type transcriptional regulator/antitoxin HigA